VQLAEVETAYALDKARLVQAEALNALLKGQLAETTASLKEAIDTAAELLAEREEEWDDEEEEDDEEQEEEVVEEAEEHEEEED
jgi:isoaspartyl peptidase/L-asparaginase-like protein (Ntn-hydrolase superfamily)